MSRWFGHGAPSEVNAASPILSASQSPGTPIIAFAGPYGGFSARNRCQKAPALVPASSSVEAAPAEQKNDDDDDEKSCHIHSSVSFVLAI